MRVDKQEKVVALRLANASAVSLKEKNDLILRLKDAVNQERDKVNGVVQKAKVKLKKQDDHIKTVERRWQLEKCTNVALRKLRSKALGDRAARAALRTIGKNPDEEAREKYLADDKQKSKMNTKRLENRVRRLNRRNKQNAEEYEKNLSTLKRLKDMEVVCDSCFDCFFVSASASHIPSPGHCIHILVCVTTVSHRPHRVWTTIALKRRATNLVNMWI